MAKLVLTAEPTFKAPVAIPVPGGKPVSVSFTFKWRTAEELAVWAEENGTKSGAELVLSMCTAWELDDEFTASNIKLLCDKYQQASASLVHVYAEQLRGAAAKN
jgi:tail assembly chaperone